MGKKGFKDLIVWQKAKDIAVLVYKMSEKGALGCYCGGRSFLLPPI